MILLESQKSTACLRASAIRALYRNIGHHLSSFLCLPAYVGFLSSEQKVESFHYQIKTLESNMSYFFNHMMQHFDIDILLDYGVTEFPEKDKFLCLVPGRKRLMDTIRMIAYRAETAMVGLITGPTVDSSDARCLLQDLFLTEADILPDAENALLNICVHSASRPAANRTLAQLFEHLNNAQVKYPGTELKMAFELGGYKAPNHAEGVN